MLHLVLMVGWFSWQINLFRLFNAKCILIQISSISTNLVIMITQFIVKNISISSYSVYSNNSNSAKYKNNKFCLHTVQCQNSFYIKQSV